MLCPQLLGALTSHLFWQAAELSGAQHAPDGMHTCPLGHAALPLTPQLTTCPQLLVACPHCWLPHVAATSSGTQPQAPFAQLSPPGHTPQFTALPQLSAVAPQRPEHQPACDWHSQTLPMPQTIPGGQSALQGRICAQLSGPVPQCVSHHARSGMHPAAASGPGDGDASAPESVAGRASGLEEASPGSGLEEASPPTVPWTSASAQAKHGSRGGFPVSSAGSSPGVEKEFHVPPLSWVPTDPLDASGPRPGVSKSTLGNAHP
jgi:hypothetical protein